MKHSLPFFDTRHGAYRLMMENGEIMTREWIKEIEKKVGDFSTINDRKVSNLLY